MRRFKTANREKVENVKQVVRELEKEVQVSGQTGRKRFDQCNNPPLSSPKNKQKLSL